MATIAFVVHAFSPADAFGGPIRKIRRLVPHLQASGLRAEVWTTTLAAASQAGLPAGIDEIEGITVRRFPVRWVRRWSAVVSLPADLPRPDGLHLLGAWSGLTYQCALLGLRRRIPLVWEPCGMLVEAGHQRWAKRALRPLHRSFARRAVVSWTSRREEAEAPVEAAESWYRPNPAPVAPVDLPSRAAARTALGLPQDGPLFGYLGRIAVRKGIERLLRNWPGPDAGGLVLTGPVEDQALAQRVDTVGRGVLRTEPVAGDALWQWLRAVDCLVLAPDYGENFGNVVVEALAAGTPAIVTPAVGAAEWCVDAGVVVVNDEAELEDWFRHPERLPAARVPESLRVEAVGDLLARQWRSLLDGGSERR